jgi:hypothetical protein
MSRLLIALLFVVAGVAFLGGERGLTAGPCDPSGQVPVPGGQTRRALIVEGYRSLGTVADKNHLHDALLTGGWQNANILLFNALTPSGLSTCISDWFGGADSDDLSLIVYTGHGWRLADDDSDERAGDQNIDESCPKPECDETFALQGLRKAAGNARDDAIRSALLPLAGTKVLVVDSCFSGGMADGNADPANAMGEVGTNRVVLMATDRNETSVSRNYLFGTVDNNEYHHAFTGYVVAGLSDNPSAPSGYARADANTNGAVTINELFDYAKTATETYVKAGTQVLQHPQIADPWTLGNTAIFTYTPGPDAVYKHPGPASGPSGRDAHNCGTGSVGGIAELPALAGDSGSSAGTYAALAGGLAAAVLALGAAGWYARRRLLR